MPTQPYHLKDGTRVPSVTTVIAKLKDSGGLVHWAWDLGMKGLDYRQVRDQAATAGTLAHALVEQWIKKENPTITGDPEVCAKAWKCFDAFLEWAEQSKLSVTHTEVALVSEKHRYGGTLDAIIVGNRRALGDWKSSARVYPEYLVQLAAYGKLWEENHPDEPIIGGFHLCRFDKEFGDFKHHWWSELDRAWDAFLHMRELYEITKELAKRAA